MPPRGRFGGRRGGSRGGSLRGGKSRGKRSFGGAPKFDSARLADVEQSDDKISEEEEEAFPSEAEYESEGSQSEDEPKQAANRPYLALMQSFAKEKDTTPSAKRRKLDHKSKKNQSSSKAEPEQEAPSDEEDEEGRDVDVVEEPEEGPEDDVVPEEEEDDEDEVPDSTDPFETHFVNPNMDEFNRRLKCIEARDYKPRQFEQDGWRFTMGMPGEEAAKSLRPPTTVPGPSSLKLKHRLVETAEKRRPTFDKTEQILYPITFGYQDLLFCGRTVKNAENLRRMSCLHAVNHVFKTRDRVIKNNAKLAKEGEDTEFEPRDQGFTRPKVLMLLPTRQAAARVVNTICALCEPEQQENRKRFDDAYGSHGQPPKFGADRPADFRELFEGNDDDMFRLGVKFTRKTIKYFAQFYNSDILIASPLGLRMAIGSTDETASSRSDKKKHKGPAGFDADFLSSIELVVVDQADALLMQNWEHVERIFDFLNNQPAEAHGCDFSRVRPWYLDGQAACFRQTLLLSAFVTPELLELHRRGRNWAGRARVAPHPYPGVLADLDGVKARQTFSRFEAATLAAEPDARFAYFARAVVPSLVKRARALARDPAAGGTLVFVPSYLDFVRVRNYFASADAAGSLSFGAVSEYADVAEASRARSHFAAGRHAVLLYSERAHHFRRYVLRGVRRVVCYAPPDNPAFYQEVVGGFLGKSEQDLRIEPGQGTVRVLFSKYDVLRLERIVGSSRVAKMIREKGDTFDFV
ncbi:DUF1253-domain-containing protein [Xylariomycetidae sp. FL0641]|nr:DUF1253-domain-containing protein [Xylariomycetidae sp. FL0641]